jgi:hypothetical protein
LAIFRIWSEFKLALEAMAEARRLGIIDYMIGEALGESSED